MPWGVSFSPNSNIHVLKRAKKSRKNISFLFKGGALECLPKSFKQIFSQCCCIKSVCQTSFVSQNVQSEDFFSSRWSSDVRGYFDVLRQLQPLLNLIFVQLYLWCIIDSLRYDLGEERASKYLYFSQPCCVLHRTTFSHEFTFFGSILSSCAKY